MDKVVNIFGTAVLTICGIFAFTLVGTLMGILAGYTVGLFFSNTFLGILAQIGIKNIEMWQFGAFIGFVGGFLKTKTTVVNK